MFQALDNITNCKTEKAAKKKYSESTQNGNENKKPSATINEK
jgi:hypothetical protein